MIYFIHIGLAIIAFLVMLNDFLDGAKKPQIEAFLGLTFIILVIITFIYFGWIAGALAISMSMVYAAISRPIAARAASQMFSYIEGEESGSYIGLPNQKLSQISKKLANVYEERDPKKILQRLISGHDHKLNDELIEYCISQPEINSIMQDFNIDSKILEDMYIRLTTAGGAQWIVGHFIAASSLAYPHTLKYLLENEFLEGDRTHTLAIVSDLIKHFERGKPLLTVRQKVFFDNLNHNI